MNKLNNLMKLSTMGVAIALVTGLFLGTARGDEPAFACKPGEVCGNLGSDELTPEEHRQLAAEAKIAEAKEPKAPEPWESPTQYDIRKAAAEEGDMEGHNITPLKLAAAVYIVKMPRAKYAKSGEFTKPETLEEETTRRVLIAFATVAASIYSGNFDPIDATALVLSTMYGESGFFEYRVHAGEKSHLGPQDGGKARCLAQLRTWPGNTILTPQEHVALAGTGFEPTKRCASTALAYYWHHAKQCKVRPRLGGETDLMAWDRRQMTDTEARDLMTHYATGNCKSFSELPTFKQNIIKARVATWRDMRGYFNERQRALP